MKRNYIIIGIVCVCSIFIIDRYFFMENRLNKTWLHQSGNYFGEPLAYNQHFILKGSRVYFFINKEISPTGYINAKSNFFLLGSYFGNLYIWDIDRKELTIYTKK